MNDADGLKPAVELAKHNRRFPNDSDAYRKARLALLAEEIDLRRHIERVAAQRRALPPGGEAPEEYGFVGPEGPVRLAALFGDKPTLVTYNWMFGARRERPCPMCTSLLSALDGEMPDILQRVAFAVIATSPVERMTAFARERGWRHLKLYSSAVADLSVLPAEDVEGRVVVAAGFLAGKTKWAWRPPTPVRIRAALPIRCRCGLSSS